MKLTIETATIDLLDELYKIEKQSFTAEAFSKKEIACLLEDYEAIGLAARANGEIAGFLIGRIVVENGKPLGYLLTLDVLPSYRRMGIAQKLLGRFEESLRQEGVIECHLEVRESNTAAKNLYSKLGYKNVGRLGKYYGTVNGLRQQKTLDTAK
ncbi:MAG TPA: GNAT family N-acetyltransferase [Candidatus Bathyarchaeia archaeon]